MNGNFERDKSAYPYAALHLGQGSDTQITKVTTREVVYKPLLPHIVAAAVAVELNAKYYARDAEALADATGSGIYNLVRLSARQLLTEGRITGPQYTQISQRAQAECDAVRAALAGVGDK